MITQAEIAKEAGCSIPTVSRALSGQTKISGATRKRIEEAAARLGYFDRPSGYSGKKGRTRTIGLVLPTVLTSSYYEDTSLLHDLLSYDGYSIILSVNHNDSESDERILRSLVSQSVNGIIHIPCTRDGAETFYRDDLPVPIVELGIRSPSDRLDVVSLDDSAAMSELVGHLTGLRHRRIALFTGREELYHIQMRAESFSRVTRAAGLLKRDCPIIFGPSSVQWSREETKRLLQSDRPPTAIIVANKPATIGVLKTLRETNLVIPRDISVVGYSSEDWYVVTEPPLTTYELPLREMGMMAAQLLLGRLRDCEKRDEEPRAVRFTGQLVIRQSTAPSPEPINVPIQTPDTLSHGLQFESVSTDIATVGNQ